MAPEQANELDAQYISRLLTIRPELSARFGAERSASLPEPTPDARRATLDLLVEWRDAREFAATEGIDENSDAAVDQRVFSASLELLHFSEEEVQLHHVDPDLLREPLSLLLQDQSAVELEPEERIDWLVQRLAALPTYLFQGRELVRAPDAPRTAGALDSVEALRRVLSDLLERTRADCASGLVAESLHRDLERAATQVEEGLTSHVSWLRNLNASQSLCTLGPESLDHLLYLRGLDIRAVEMREVAQGMVEELRVEQTRLLKSRFASASKANAIAKAELKSPQNNADVHAWTEELLQEARRFVFGRDEFPLPTNEEVIAERVSPELGLFAEGAHWLPPRHRSAFATSHLLLPELSQPTEFPRYCLAELERLVSFYAYPGRHLLQVWSDRSTNLVRGGAPAGFMSGISSTWGLDTVLGWSHYAEEWMREAAFRDSPEVRFTTLRAAIRRAVLAYVDVSLSGGWISLEQGKALLMRIGEFPLEQAKAHIQGCLQSPSAGMSALLGKMRLSQLRKEARVAWRSGFNERHFHELILLGGTMPLAYHFELLEGAYAPLEHASQGSP